MSFWNIIGEFFLFRWLFVSHKHDETKQNLSDTSSSFGNKDIIDDNDTHIILVAAMVLVAFAMTIATMAIHNLMMIY